MAFVTDPDDLDRFQVLLDPEAETIKVRGLGADRTATHTAGDTTDTSNDVFYDPDTDVDFTADGVTSGDILTIVSGTGGIINHYVVDSVVNTQTLLLNTSGTNPSFPSQQTGLTYKISDPTAADGPNGGNVGDGMTMQALYSWLKEEWRTLSITTAPDLIRFTFPLESITREQFEIGGPTHSDWDFADNDTRNLMRTGGWAQIDVSGVTQARYSGIITLGTLDANAQVYYLQGSEAGRVPLPFVLPGAVNQAILVYSNTTSDDDLRTFLQLFVRKKGKSYAQSEIADIGVTTLETIVNRFPLTHVNDPAINVSGGAVTDGELSGDGTAATTVYQTMATVDATATDGVVADADTTDGVFELTSVTSTFVTDGLLAKDTIELTTGSDQGVYEIVSIGGETALVLKQEPVTASTGTEFTTITGGSGVSFTSRTRAISVGTTSAGLSPLSDNTGTLTDAAATFVSDGVTASHYVQITGPTAATVGWYKIISVDGETQLTLDLEDQAFSNETGQSYIVTRAGMSLQRKATTATQVTDLQFIEDGGGAGIDTIKRLDSGDYISDGWTDGMCATIAGSTSNDGNYVVATVTSDELVLVSADSSLTNETAPSATADGESGFVRTLNSADYPFHWRLFGNNGTLQECYTWIQKELRRGRGSGEAEVDIDGASPTQRGDTADLLMTYAAPNGVTLDMFIVDLSTADINNATFTDMCGTGRQEAFVAGVTISLNTNLTDDIPATGTNKVVVFFTTNPSGDFGTQDAVIVNDAAGSPMSFTDQSTTITTSFDYDNNTQGGRSIADADVTIVAIGEGTAQYVQATGTISRQSSNTFSLVAALERNYSNP
jgi:hypothetical protein